MSVLLFSGVVYCMCVDCMLVLNLVWSIGYHSFCLELYQFNYVWLWRCVALLPAQWPVCLPSVYVADDEVCLGQLQALRLGKERAAAFDEKRAYWQHVRWVSTFCSRLKRPERSSSFFFFQDLLTFFLERFYAQNWERDLFKKKKTFLSWTWMVNHSFLQQSSQTFATTTMKKPRAGKFSGVSVCGTSTNLSESIKLI